MLRIFAAIYGFPDKGQILYRNTGIQGICNLYDRMFTHTVGNHVCTGIQKYTSLYLIRPVIIMSQPSQTRLNPTQNNGGMLVRSPDQIAIYDDCPVGTKSHLTAGGIGIFLSVLFRNGIVIDHGVHIAGRHKKSQPGLSENLDTLRVFPVRLGNDSHRITMTL